MSGVPIWYPFGVSVLSRWASKLGRKNIRGDAKHGPKKYVFWELKILKYIGYDIDLKKIINSEIIKNEKKYYLKSNTNKKYIPNFLIDKDDKRIDNDSLLKGLNLVGDYMNKYILKPNNINYPNARLEFINLFK